MKKMIVAAMCVMGLLAGGVSAQAAANKDVTADKTAYAMTEQLFNKREKGSNIVFSPYSLQQMLPLIGANTTEKSVQQQLQPYVVPGIRIEKLMNTKTGSLILLDKKLSRDYNGRAEGDLRLVGYPEEALQAKKDFQERILGSVIDSDEPKGNLNFYTAAHYFAEWQTKFDKSLTQERSFTKEDGTVIKPLTMRQHFKHGTGKLTEDYSMASVWGKKGSVVYFIKPEKNAAEVAKHLDSIIADFEAYKGTVHNIWLEVPKISVKNKLDLKRLLADMGLTTFCDGSLYFDKITGRIPYVLASASQTATLDINEEYAEGKAITEFGFETTAAMTMDEKEYTILMDHPYFIVIKDRTRTGTQRVVFVAWVGNPA